MRFLLFDKVIELEKGKRIVGVKSVGLSEDFFEEHFPKVAVTPGTLMIEAAAQVAGWLVNVSHDFKLLAIMSLIEGVSIVRQIKAGDQVLLEATLDRSTARGSECSGTVWKDAEIAVRVERILFYHYLVSSAEVIDRVKEYFTYLSGNYPVDSR